MAIRVEFMNPSQSHIFVDYIDHLKFGHAPEWSTCYCRYYHTKADQDEWMMRSGNLNRSEAIMSIKEGSMQGFLAYDGDKCVGWLNANDSSAYIRIEEDIKPIVKDQKVACTMCFIIHPDYRNKGIARQLLSAAVAHYKALAYDGMLGMPFVSNEFQKQYRGTLNMYKELGYKEIEVHESVHVMWNDFKGGFQ